MDAMRAMLGVGAVLGGVAAAAEPAAAPAVTLRSIAQPLVQEVLDRWELWGKTAKTLGPWCKQDFAGVSAIHKGLAAELYRVTATAEIDYRVGTVETVFDTAMCILAGTSAAAPWGTRDDRLGLTVQHCGAFKWLKKNYGDCREVRANKLHSSGWLGDVTEVSQLWLEVPSTLRMAALQAEKELVAANAKLLKAELDGLAAEVDKSKREGTFDGVPASLAARLDTMVDGVRLTLGDTPQPPQAPGGRG
jgi:hypothetical protein